MIASTSSLSPTTATVIFSISTRSNALRSASVVVGACQRADRFALGRGQHQRLGLAEARIVIGQPLGLGQGGLPVAFQGPGDQPVLRLGELVLAPGPVGGVAGALEPLM